jgi:hypothetical protein
MTVATFDWLVTVLFAAELVVAIELLLAAPPQAESVNASVAPPNIERRIFDNFIVVFGV